MAFLRIDHFMRTVKLETDSWTERFAKRALRPRPLAVAWAALFAAVASTHAQLIITPTFDSSITSLPNAVAVEAAINAAIAQTTSQITTFHLDNVSIDFVYDPTTDLGANISATNDLSLSQYVADLKSNPTKSALQTSAIATMPTGPIAALNNNTMMTLTAANLMAIGETSLANAAIANNGGFNGTIYLNLSIMNVSRTSGQNPNDYDLQTVTQHELDEVLGVGGYASTLWNPTGPLPKTLGSLDLFRYSANGVRSFTASPNANAYFSVDGGKTVLVHFLQTGDGDYADYSKVSTSDQPNTPPNVQDAFATSWGDNPNPANLGVNELTAFQVVGYNLVALPSYWLGQTNNKWTSPNWATNVTGTLATSIPGANSNITFSATGAANQGNTLLGQNFTIHSLTIADPSAVMISSGLGGPYTLTISGSAGTGINVQTGAGLFTLNANLQFMGSSNTITVNNTAGAVINGAIFGSTGLTKAGTGTLTLGASNTYTGNTVIQKGSVVLTAVYGLPNTTNVTLGTASSATTASLDLHGNSLTVNGIALASGNTGGIGNVITSSTGSPTFIVDSSATNSTFAGLLSGSLSLIKDGNGTTLTLLAANTYTGSTTVGAGTLQIGNGNTAGSIANSSGVTVANSGKLSLVNLTGKTFALNVTNGITGVGTLNFNSTATNTVSGNLTDGAVGQLSVTQTGSGVTILTGNDTYTGSTTISAGTLQVGDGTSGHLTGTSGVTISGSGTLAINLADGGTFNRNVSLGAANAQLTGIATGTNTISGLISGTGDFTQAGTGTTILNNTETYTGTTSITTGTLEVDGSLASGSVVNIATAGTLSGTGTINGKATMTGNGTINFGSAGTIVGTLAITGGNWAGQGTVNGLVTVSSGAFNLNGSLTALAGLNVTGGTLGGTGTLTGNLNYTSSANSNFGGALVGASSLTMNKASSTLTLSGISSYTGATTISAGTLQIGDGTSGDLTNTSGIIVSGTGVLAINLADGATFDDNVSLSATGAQVKATGLNTNTLSGIISGSGGFTEVGGGITILTAAQTYTGATNITLGILKVDGSLASASTVNIATGGELQGKGTINGKVTMTGAGTIALDPAGTIVGTLAITGGNWTGGGVVDGLVTSSSGLFELAGSLTAPAGLNVTGGTLDGTGTLMGSLNYTSSASSTFDGIITGPGVTLTMNKASSTLILGGDNTYTGVTTISAGTLQIGDGTGGNLTNTSGVTVSGTGVLAIDLVDGATFTRSVSLGATGSQVKTNASGTNTLTGVISGQGGLTQAGTGTTILTVAETYTGATTITAGTLQVNVSLDPASVVNIGTAGTLAGSGTIRGKATLTGNGSINFGSNGKILGTLAVTGGNWNGLGAVDGLITSSSGAFNLNGDLTAPAGLNVTGGTLAGTGTLTGNLTYAGATSTFGGTITGAGSTLTMNKSSVTLTLTGNNTYTGATSINAGTLQIGNGTSGKLTGTSGITVSGTGALAIDLIDGSTFDSNVLLNATGALVKGVEAGTNTLTGVISGKGGFTQLGTGTTILTSDETYTGKTTITTGTLEVDASLTAASLVNIGTAGTLSGTGMIKGKTTLTGNGAIDFGSAGTILNTLGVTGGNWNGQGTVVGLVTSSSGVFNLNGNLTTPTGLSVTGGTLAGTGTLTGNLTYGGATSTFGGTIDGTGSKLTMNKASVTLNLTGNETYTGTTTISAGTLQVGNGTSGNLVNTSGVTASGTGVLAIDLVDGATFDRKVVLSAKGAQVKAIEAGTNTLTGVISGIGGLTQAGTGTTILHAAETYTGKTTVTTGTLQVDVSLASGSLVSIATGGTLTGDGTIFGKTTLTGNGIIDLGSAGAINSTLGITGGNWNGEGTVGGLVTSSSGVFNLNGSLTASTGLSVTAGTLAGAGTLTGSLTYAGTNDTFGGIIAGAGATVTMNKASNTLTLTGTNTYTGGTTIKAGTLALGNGTTPGASLGTGNVTISSGGTLALNLKTNESLTNDVANAGKLNDTATSGLHTISGTISGKGTFTKTGGSAAELTGNNTYTGATTISGGALVADNASGSATGTSKVAVNSGGLLGGSGTILGPITLNSGGIIAPGIETLNGGTTLHATSLMWNSGGTLHLNLGASGDELTLTGALTKGGSGAYIIDLSDVGITQSSYTLLTFASTTFLATNFTLELPTGYTGTLQETGTSLSVVNLTFTPGHASEPLVTSLSSTDSETPLPTRFHTEQTLSPAQQSLPATEADSTSLTLVPTPEPSSTLLASLGALALFRRRRKS